MNPEHWQQVEEVFEAALEHDPEQRAAFLDRACAKDETIRREVEARLASHDAAPDFMDATAAAGSAGELSGAATKLSARQRFGHFEIVSLLGAGGMGEVYLAHDSSLNRKIALKLLPSYFTDDQERVRRFEREARAASALNHHNILTIHEIGRADGRHFIATEFVEGETLRGRMERAGRLQFIEALDVAAQIASALQAAHAAGVIHRDIKPENIMLRRDGFVKVLDFGLAKLIEKQEPSLNTEAETKMLLQTMPGMVMGTPSYMSPEQARGREMDTRTDIFSLGVVLYEMLAGRAPFAGESVTDVLVAILHDETPSLLIHRQDTPAELERIVAKTLQKNKDERYQTAKDLLIDLKSLQKRLEFEAELAHSSTANKETEAKTQTFKAGTQTSIAVLPFANMSADAENEYFCDGLAEELLNALAKIDDLKVVARTSAFSFKGKNANASEIGNALNVKTVLEGSVRKSANHLRITVQLVNASDGYHLWSERYDREMKDIFDIQDEITLAVVDALKVKLFGEEKAAVLKRYTNNTEAYLLYLKGMYYRWKLAPEEFGKSRDFFQRAVDADPSFALAYFGLSSYYGYGTAWGLLSMPPNEGWQKAEAAMAKVMELDDTLPEVHLSLAAFRLVNYRDWDVAGKRIEHAAGLNPNFPEIHHLYSFYLLAVGRFDDAISEGKRVLELDPLSLNHSRFLGICFYFARLFDEAIKQFKQALELDPNNASVHESLGEVFAQKGMFGEALAAWQRALTLIGDDELAAILKNADAETDFAAAVCAIAQKRIERMRGIVKSGGFVLAIGFARAYVMLGDTEQAFHWLGKACEERNVFPLLMNSDPFYDGLRGDTRFENLRRRIGLKTNGKSTSEPSEARIVLLAPATIDAKEAMIADTNVANEQTHERKSKARLPWLPITLLSLLIAAAGFFAYRSFTSTASKQIESIAVLPFVNESGNADNEYLSDGMTETLISSLSQLPKLNVKARSSVFRYKGKDVSPQTIGKELSVQAVLLGRVIQRNDLLTLSWELVDARTENVIWSERYNRKQADIVSLQSEIARDVSNKLRMRLSGADQQKLAKNYTENAEAYQLYLKGRYYWYKFPAKEFEKSRDYYQQAIDVDPNYALAYAGLAEYYGFGAANGFLPPSDENWSKTEAAVSKALALDDTLPDAYNALAGVKQSNHDWAGAERELRRAIELNPNYAEGRRHYATFLIEEGHSEEALAQMRKVLELEPLSVPSNIILAVIFYRTRQSDRAIEQYQKTLELDPNDAYTHELLGDTYEQKGMQKEAVVEWSRALRLTGDNESATMLERTFAASGFNAAVRALWQKKLERFNEKAKRGEYVPAMNYALAYTRLADKEQAFAWLAKAEQERNGMLRYAIKLDPIYDSLRDDPRFQDLLRRIGLQS